MAGRYDGVERVVRRRRLQVDDTLLHLGQAGIAIGHISLNLFVERMLELIGQRFRFAHLLYIPEVALVFGAGVDSARVILARHTVAQVTWPTLATIMPHSHIAADGVDGAWIRSAWIDLPTAEAVPFIADGALALERAGAALAA